MNDAWIPVFVLALGLLGWWWECIPPRRIAGRNGPEPIECRPDPNPLKPGEGIVAMPDGSRYMVLVDEIQKHRDDYEVGTLDNPDRVIGGPAWFSYRCRSNGGPITE